MFGFRFKQTIGTLLDKVLRGEIRPGS